MPCLAINWVAGLSCAAGSMCRSLLPPITEKAVVGVSFDDPRGPTPKILNLYPKAEMQLRLFPGYPRIGFSKDNPWVWKNIRFP